MSERISTRVVAVLGCDDITTINVTATRDQWRLIDRLAFEITAAGGGCRPVMDADYECTSPGLYELDLTADRDWNDPTRVRLPVHTGTARAFARHLDNLDEDLKPIDRTMIAALLEDAADELDRIREAVNPHGRDSSL